MRALAITALVALAAAQSTTFTANLAGNQVAQTFPILACVGSSHGSTTLREDWRRHLAAIRTDAKFSHVRFHGVLDDDMSTYLNGGANMFNVFSTYDFLLSIGMKPIVELSFMPQLLASNASQTVFHYQGGISPPANWSAWSTFINQFVSLLVQRYGLAEVATWKFEVWNEPDWMLTSGCAARRRQGLKTDTRGFYFEGGCCGPDCGSKPEYYQLYNVTAQAIKAVDASLLVGGPATAQLLWLDDFVAWAQSTGTPLDFVSSHLYPTDPAVNPDRDGFFAAINASAALVAAAGLPLTMTEFNSGLGIPNGQDDEYSSAFVVHQHMAFQGVANLDTLSFWTFSDVFEEQGFDSTPWNGKFGMQTIYQVPKPVYRAMQLLAGLPAATVPISVSTSGPETIYRATSVTSGTLDATVAIDATSTPGSTRVVALVTNFNTPNMPIAAQTITLQFSGLPRAAPASATLTLIDGSHASALPVWQAQGSPMYPNATQIAAQLAASQLAPTPIKLSPAGTAAASVTLTLQPQAVAQIEFTV